LTLDGPWTDDELLSTARLDAVLELPVELNVPEDWDCSLDGTAPDDERLVDTGTDAVVDTGTDAVVDTGADAVVDTGTDAVVDTGADAVVDTCSDDVVE
jgi:hypothetical protein